jgi:hypothetical protein
MSLDPSKTAPREIYNLMIGLVTPLPIALANRRRCVCPSSQSAQQRRRRKRLPPEA